MITEDMRECAREAISWRIHGVKVRRAGREPLRADEQSQFWADLFMRLLRESARCSEPLSESGNS